MDVENTPPKRKRKRKRKRCNNRICIIHVKKENGEVIKFSEQS